MSPDNKNKDNSKSQKSNSRSSDKGFWNSIESYVSQAGRWAWVWVLISAFFYMLYLIWAIYWYSVAASILGTYWWREWIFNIIWDGIYLVLALIFAFAYIRPHFSIPCKEMKWQFLVDDGFNIGSWRIPKMLFFGILFEIFGRGWGGALILFPALAIIIWAPVKIDWNAKKTQKKPTSTKTATSPKPTTPTKTQSSTQTKSTTTKTSTPAKTQSSTQTKSTTTKTSTPAKTQSSTQTKSTTTKTSTPAKTQSTTTKPSTTQTKTTTTKTSTPAKTQSTTTKPSTTQTKTTTTKSSTPAKTQSSTQTKSATTTKKSTNKK
jgi:hypothetical protein